jgi:arylsulfatase A-like enzyme
MLGEHGFTSKVLPYEASTHIPMSVFGPKIKPSVCDALVLNIDILPTILALAGQKQPSNIHGKNLKKVLLDKKSTVRKNFVYEGLGSYGGAKPNLSVISDRFRYIVTYDDSTLSKINFRELYDTSTDMIEMKNLDNSSEFITIIKECEKTILEHKTKILGLP